MTNIRRKHEATATASNAAEDALEALDPGASAEIIADAIAEYILTRYTSRYFHLSILHDVRPSTPVRLNHLRERFLPSYQPDHPVGPCPLPYDWSHKNTVGISTRDRERAREWIIQAALAGYSVSRYQTRATWGSGPGSIEYVRQRARERRAA